jgi:predicted  nucleic acid-binding Zn-ribbon protein
VLKNLQQLIELQALDVRLGRVRARLAAFPKKFAEADAQASSARKELEESKAAQLATIRDRKKYELDVEQWKERVRKYRDQTSQVKTNEAYKALQHEVETAEREIARAEDRLLEQMVNAEDYDRRVKASEKRLKEVEEVVRTERTTLESEKAVAEKDLADLTAQRATIVADIDENLLEHYTKIAKKHGGVAVSELRDDRCGACGMRVRPHVSQEMQRGTIDKLYQCESCTRILYYLDVQAPPEPSSTSQASA